MGQAGLRLQPSPVDAQPHRASQRTESQLGVGGYTVEVEGQNSFQLRGKSATLAGRPDLVARRDDEAVIVDAKTGQENPSHDIQVMIYLYAVPKTLEKYRNLKPRGQVTTGTTRSAFRRKPSTTSSCRTSAR